MHCVHGACALTCVTAQNTLGVTRVDPLAPAAVVAQIDAVAIDLGIAAAKTGMLLNRDIISAVVDRLTADPLPALVVDPVMVSRTGAQLIDDDAVALMRDRLLPLATVATPNCYEAQLLAGRAIESLADLIAAAKTIWQLGPQAVVVKGGGLPGDLRGVDVWFAGDEPVVLRTETVDTPHTHGTGCSLSAAIAANLALGQAPLAATQAAKTYVTQALRHALAIGQGQGPIGHFFPLLNGWLNG